MRQAYDTYCVLGGFDSQCRDYIEKYAAMQIKVVSDVAGGTGTGGAAGAAATAEKGIISLKDCIVKGLKEPAFRATKELLEDDGTGKPKKGTMEIINEDLVPALDLVGQGFEKGTMFLPQLLMSAEAARPGIRSH